MMLGEFQRQKLATSEDDVYVVAGFQTISTLALLQPPRQAAE
jgi:hypothetical protein